MVHIWKLDCEQQLLDKSAKIGRLIKPEDLAEVAGVSRQSIYLWRLYGVENLSASKAVKLANFLDCQIWDIWKIEEVADEERRQGQLAAVGMA